MSDTYLLVIAAVAVFVLIIIFSTGFWLRRRPAKLNKDKFRQSWREVQKLCKDESTWPLAVINGDKLLDEALRKSKYRGKTMGERLVAAQRQLSDNDSVWYGHKLRNKLVHEEAGRLKKDSVVDALTGFRQALKDLGAL
jgi:hypothetical protein